MSQYAKTRIKHKHDIEANWSISNIMPLDGEIIIYDPDDTHATPRFKVGDGKTALKDLPFVNNGEGGGENNNFATEEFVTNITNELDLNKANVTDPEFSGNLSMNAQGTTGFASASIGFACAATGSSSFATGMATNATGDCSHTEGTATKASGYAAHAEGANTQATDVGAHSEGFDTKALARGAHVEGEGTIANAIGQHVQGKYNIQSEDFVHIIGNGESATKRSNAHTIDWDGNAWFAGDIRIGGSGYDDYFEGKYVCTEQDVWDVMETVDWKLTEKQNTSNDLTIVPGEAEWKEINLDGKTQHYYLELEGFIDETNEMVDTVGGTIYIVCNNLEKDEHTFYLYINVSCEKFVTIGLMFEHETEEGDSFIPSITWIEEPTIDYPHTKMLLAFKTIDGGKSWVANQCYSMEVTN